MLNFDMHIPTRIIFGQDSHKEIGNLLKPHAQKILLHYGGGSIKKSGVYNEIVASLQREDIAFTELGGVVPNPRLSLAQMGIEICRQEKIDLILAVGGGSVIDSAKAIAMGVFYHGDVWEIYDQTKPITQALPVACVLTIPAAGSESSPNTVLTNTQTKQKFGYGSPLLRPLLSVVNPELFYTLPPNQVANGIADMMSHIFERYFTNTPHTEITDGLCETVLRTIITNAPRVLEYPFDYQAWCQIGMGGTLAHNGLLGMGREQDWACHAMEHELSAIYDVAHGAGLAVLTPCWMQYVYSEHLDIFAQFAANVMGVANNYRDCQSMAREGINRLREFYRKIGLPSTLGELGIGEDQLEVMAKKATDEAYGQENPIGGLQKLRWKDVLSIYNACR